MKLVRLGNKYPDNEPWKKQATDPQRETILHVSPGSRPPARLMELLPFTSEKLHGMLNLVHAKWTLPDETSLPLVTNAANVFVRRKEDRRPRHRNAARNGSGKTESAESGTYDQPDLR